MRCMRVLAEVEGGDKSRKTASPGLLSARGGEPGTGVLRVPLRLRLRWGVSSLCAACFIVSPLDLMR